MRDSKYERQHGLWGEHTQKNGPGRAKILHAHGEQSRKTTDSGTADLIQWEEKLVAWPCAAPENEEKISSKTAGQNSKGSLQISRGRRNMNREKSDETCCTDQNTTTKNRVGAQEGLRSQKY
jgi:hypothetical protein